MVQVSVFIHVVLLTAGVQLAVGEQGDGLFKRYIGEWEGTCRRINSSSTCYRTRDVHCQTAADQKPAPWRYCTEREMGRLTLTEECQCDQDCVVTKWSEWTPCKNGRAYATRQRTIAAPKLRNGKPCPALHEKKRCTNSASIAELDRKHTWKLGRWGPCVPIQDCGHGLRNRSVDCVDYRERIVNQTLCLEEEAYRRVLPPQTFQLCEVPCSCLLSVWGPWSEKCVPDCSLPVPRLFQHRSRPIRQYPTLGRQCEDLEQSRRCQGEAKCPTYRWHTSGWSDCSVKDEEASCGVGLKQRYVYCIEEHVNGSMMHVKSVKCSSSEKPSSIGSCSVSCDHPCIVTEWGSWGQCRNNTCEATYTHRTRSVLVQPSGKYETCPHLQEFRECPQLPCTYWCPQEWSECFPDDISNCGWGTESRNVPCCHVNGTKDMPRHLCKGQHPNQVQVCYRHCVDDECVISDWSEWSDCSETCDNITGTQSRSRYFIVNENGPCEHEHEHLFEERNCSVATPCTPSVYYIEYSKWGTCWPTGATVDGEICEGIQSRNVTCFRDEVTLGHRECPIPFDESETQSCNVSCTDECQMSDWSEFSECSSKCDKTRTRRLLRFGESCPYVDSSGVETDTISCPCSAVYSWMAEDWSSCRVFPTPLSQLSHAYVNPLIPDPGALCGQGYRNRSVVCKSSDGVVEVGFCDVNEKPVSFESCLVPCDNRCIISDWSNYSVCNSTVPLKRTRHIEPSRGPNDYITDCPQLRSVVLNDIETCPSHDFRHFLWQVSAEFGELHRCLLDPSETCGQGQVYKTITCIDRSNMSVTVSPEFCDQESYAKFETVSQCTEPCNIDCEYDEEGWSVWGPCSVSCGRGYRTRTRTIRRGAQNKGRACGRLNETSTCEMPACNYLEYSYSPPSLCQPLNDSSGCGDGVNISHPICLVNGVAQPDVSACSSALGPVPAERQQDCRVPCVGECVVSQWTEWKWCIDCQVSCYRRTRKVLRKISPSQPDMCDQIHIQEELPCPAHSQLVWVAHDWKDCIVDWTSRSDSDYCGDGIQHRIVECQESGAVVQDEKCSHLLEPDSARPCHLLCPIDCEVSSFSAWSGCSRCTSDDGAVMQRKRYVLVQPENGGRGCPHLTEKRSCPNIGCDEYFVEMLDCPSEQSDQLCGEVTHTALLCRKNREYVPLDECVRANNGGEIIHNAALLTKQDTYCNIPCPMPPECSFINFSAWSECLHMCDWPRANLTETSDLWFQFRFQTLLSSWEGKEESCLRLQQDIQPCTLNISLSDGSPKCLRFDWITSEWSTDNTRQVQCRGSDGNEVEESACVKSDEPVAQRSTEHVGICDCPFRSNCYGNKTACFCEEGFEMVGSLCLPIEGCLNAPELNGSQQCLPGEMCGSDGVCECPQLGGCTPSTTSSTPGDTSVTTLSPSNDPGDASFQAKDILLIVLISCVPLLVIIIIILILIFITCKCQQHLDRRQRRRKPPPTILHQNQQLNNQSDQAQSLKDGGVRVQEIATEMPCPPMMHNGSASSGFVDEMENDMMKYGQTSFNGYSQTQSDIDEAGFPAEGNPYFHYPLPHRPLAHNPPYSPYDVDSDSYHARDSSGRRMMEPHMLQPHSFPRSLSEEAQLARMNAGYNHMLDGQQSSQDFPDHAGLNDARYYPPSPAFTRAHPQPSHRHHYHHSHHNHMGAGGRDNRLMTGMDNSLVRAIEEVMASESGSRSPSVASDRSRSSSRRSSRRRHHRGHAMIRVGSPHAGIQSHSAQGFYGYNGEGEVYQSNTLPRSGSSKRMPAMLQRSPRHVASGASPLVTNMSLNKDQYTRSASNELLDPRGSRGAGPPHDQPPPAEMPQAIPDDYPITFQPTNPTFQPTNSHTAPFQATNPHTASPPTSTAQFSDDGDYDHIAEEIPPPPPPRANFQPPSSTLAPQPPSESVSPRSPSSSGSQFPQELFQAIQKRANSKERVTRPINPASSMATSAGPVSRTFSDSQVKSKPPTRFTAASLAAYERGNPPTPPTRVSSNQGRNDSQPGGVPPPPPPPPPPVRST